MREQRAPRAVFPKASENGDMEEVERFMGKAANPRFVGELLLLL